MILSAIGMAIGCLIGFVLYRWMKRYLNVGTCGITTVEKITLKANGLLKGIVSQYDAIDDDAVALVKQLVVLIEKHEQYYHVDLSDMKKALDNFSASREDSLGVVSSYIQELKSLPSAGLL